jgi:hypothetical protein
MQGEFRGDFTRDTFDPRNQFLRVLMQQGRVQLDADWNEQVAILLHYVQTLAEDLIGAHGGPVSRAGFWVDPTSVKQEKDTTNITDFTFSTGHYYICGLLCENFPYFENSKKITQISYNKQPSHPTLMEDRLPAPPCLVYLDVWERHITYLQDESIREVALDGPDTATRSQLVWQVKAQSLSLDELKNLNISDCDGVVNNWPALLQEWQPSHRGSLQAKAKETEKQTDPCLIHPDSRYRRVENQLYRVEIHHPGEAGTATFKWSRENGSVVFAIEPNTLPATGKTAAIQLSTWWHDDRFALNVGDWVEIVNDDYILRQQDEPLWQVEKIEPMDRLISLKREEDMASSVVGKDLNKHPMLRRWEGTAKVEEDTDTKENWLTLENGIQIQFKAQTKPSQQYRTSDYWLIPARTATGDVEWPKLDDKTVALPPHGIQHHYAPLAVITNDGTNIKVLDCRRQFYALARTYYYIGSGAGVGTDLIYPNACEGVGTDWI